MYTGKTLHYYIWAGVMSETINYVVTISYLNDLHNAEYADGNNYHSCLSVANDLCFHCNHRNSDCFHCYAPQPVSSPDKVDVSVIFHSLPRFESSVDPSARQVNVLYHLWALKGM